jgi:hypothetical protein
MSGEERSNNFIFITVSHLTGQRKLPTADKAQPQSEISSKKIGKGQDKLCTLQPADGKFDLCLDFELFSC